MKRSKLIEIAVDSLHVIRLRFSFPSCVGGPYIGS